MSYHLGHDGKQEAEQDQLSVALALLVVVVILLAAGLVVLIGNIELFDDGSAVLGGSVNLGCIVRFMGC